MRKWILSAVVLALCCLAWACAQNDGSEAEAATEAEEQAVYQTFADLAGKTIATHSGGTFDSMIEAQIKNPVIVYYDDLIDQADALRGGVIDAIAVDQPVAFVFVGENPDLRILDDPLADDAYVFAAKKDSDLTATANEVIDRLQADGTLTEIAARWLGTDPAVKKLPAAEEEGTDGVLRYGCDVSSEPMCYKDDEGNVLGMDIEIVTHIAQALNMKLEIYPMTFASMLEALETGEVDMIGGCLSETAQRQARYDLTTPYYQGGVAVIVKGED